MMLVVNLMIFQACTKEEPGQSANIPPDCSIMSPKDNQENTVGEKITISVDASDSDGNITGVSITINDELKTSLTKPPFVFEWNTEGQNPGSYLIKANCIDDKGGSASSEITFKLVENEFVTFDTFTDPRDGRTYITLKINDQTWFTDNLSFDSAAPIKKGGDNYGAYYSWKSAQKACPGGWHLPTDDEWKEFEKSIFMKESDADRIGWRGTVQGWWLKSKEGWENDLNGSDRFGFNALPAGYLNEEGELFHVKTDALFWTATFHDSEESGWYRKLSYNADGIYRSSTFATARFSVRCVKD